jgi:hypothetical protein
MSFVSELPAYGFLQNNLAQGPTLNSRKNIISGPNMGDYWSHSSGLEKPMYREEGPLPIQGNIGSLLKQEQLGNYAMCSNNTSIGGGPNCTGVFNKDLYTTVDTCGDNCKLSAPESFGIQSFGMTDDKMTNIHGLHAYQNIRAGVEGKGPSDSYGCYEFIPNLGKTSGNSCELNYSKFENETAGDFTSLPSWKQFSSYNYQQ